VAHMLDSTRQQAQWALSRALSRPDLSWLGAASDIAGCCDAGYSSKVWTSDCVQQDALQCSTRAEQFFQSIRGRADVRYLSHCAPGSSKSLFPRLKID
jgi:hypothetical protein